MDVSNFAEQVCFLKLLMYYYLSTFNNIEIIIDCKKKFGCEECCSATYYPCNVKDKYESLISSTFKNLSTFWDPDAEYSGYYGQETIAFGSCKILIKNSIDNLLVKSI